MKRPKPSRYKAGQNVICIHGYNGYLLGTIFVVYDGNKCKEDNKPAIWVKRDPNDAKPFKIKLKYIRRFDD